MFFAFIYFIVRDLYTQIAVAHLPLNVS